MSLDIPDDWQTAQTIDERDPWPDGFRVVRSDCGVDYGLQAYLNAHAHQARLTHTFWLATPDFRRGGPLLGYGLEAVNQTRQMRLGWEVAIPSWWIHSLTLDTNFDDRWAAALISGPTVVIAQRPFRLDLGLSLGVPFRMAPELDIGARGDLVFGSLLAGFGVYWDIYPGLLEDRSEALHEVVVYGRLSI